MMLKAPSKVLPSLPPPYSTALAPTAHEGQRRIDARGLHGWLGPKRMFANWIADRIADYGFVGREDYLTKMLKTGGRPRTEYLLTIGMAKELAMLERSSIGSETRRYFIRMEQVALG